MNVEPRAMLLRITQEYFLQEPLAQGLWLWYVEIDGFEVEWCVDGALHDPVIRHPERVVVERAGHLHDLFERFAKTLEDVRKNQP